MHHSTSRILLAGITSALALTSASEGALIAYDPFSQAVGVLNNTSSSGGGAVWPVEGNNWFGDNGSSAVIAGSLTYGPLVTEGNQASLDARNGDIYRAFNVTYGGGTSDLWISFLIVATGENTGISLFNIGAERNFMGAGGGSGQTIGLQSPDINTGVARGTATHFYVLHLDMTGAADAVHTLYVDPEFSSLGNGTAPTGGITGTANLADFTWDRIRLGDFNDTATDSRFDEFRMGTTWADVSPIPEPSTAGLLGLTTVGIAALRRRRA